MYVLDSTNKSDEGGLLIVAACVVALIIGAFGVAGRSSITSIKQKKCIEWKVRCRPHFPRDNQNWDFLPGVFYTEGAADEAAVSSQIVRNEDCESYCSHEIEVD